MLVRLWKIFGMCCASPLVLHQNLHSIAFMIRKKCWNVLLPPRASATQDFSMWTHGRNGRQKCEKWVNVLKRHLGLRIGSKPGDGTIAPELGHFIIEFVGKDDSQGHALFSLVCGIAEHQALQNRVWISWDLDLLFIYCISGGNNLNLYLTSQVEAITWSPAPMSSSPRSTWTPWAISGDCCSRATNTLQVL